MQLDSTRITIRERNSLDILDLALCVCRAHAGPLFFTTCLGALPMMATNAWLLGDYLTGAQFDLGVEPLVVYSYVWRLVFLTFLEMPLAAAVTTLYLGEAMFEERPSVRAVLVNLARSLPQFVLLELGPRAVVVLPAVLVDDEALITLSTMALSALVFFYFAIWPYLGEIVLLERNPLVRRRKTGMATLGRAWNLHGRNAGDLMGRWFVGGTLGVAWVLALWMALWHLRGVLTNHWDAVPSLYLVFLPAAVWAVAGFFTVVRFLSYLDLRIKNEGWEIELRMRAEAARLTRQLA